MKKLLYLTVFTLHSAQVLAQSAPSIAAVDTRFSQVGPYWVSWGYNAINLSSAWKYDLTKKTLTGYSGKGVTVAVFDTGLNTANTKFNLAKGYNIYTGGTVTKDNQWHGTFVSGIVGANLSTPGGNTMYGVAPNSRIMPIQIFDTNGAASWTDAQLARGINFASSNSAKIFNNSWNAVETLGELGSGALNQLNASMPGQITAWKTAVDRGVLMVWAAGNYGKSDPGYIASLPTLYTKLAPNWVTVIATDQTGSKASWSNSCGISAEYCMAAPGSGIVSLYGTGLAIGSGTSFAAPMVSGAAAIMFERWPFLKGNDIRKILFDTANKTGIYADTATYGQGMLDLNKAFNPVGTTKIATTSSVNGPGVAVQNTSISPSAAFGKVLTQSLGGVDAMVLDDYKRDYTVNLANGVGNTIKLNNWANQLAVFGSDTYLYDEHEIMQGSANGMQTSFATSDSANTDSNDTVEEGFNIRYMNGNKSATKAVKVKQDLTTKSSVGINVSPSIGYGPFAQNSIRPNDLVLTNSVGNPFMNMAPNSNSAVIAGKIGDNWTTRLGAFTNTVMYDKPYNIINNMPLMTGFNLENTLNWKHGYVSASAGMVNERNTVLGSYSSGALSLGRGANTGYVGLTAGIKLTDNLQAFAGTTAGYTVTQADQNSMIKNVKNLTSGNAYTGISLTGVFGTGDRIGFVASVPLRVNSGQLMMSVPTSRDIDGNVFYTDKNISFTNKKFEFGLQAFYTLPLDQWQSVGFGVGTRLNAPDLDRGYKNETISMARYNLRF